MNTHLGQWMSAAVMPTESPLAFEFSCTPSNERHMLPVWSVESDKLDDVLQVLRNDPEFNTLPLDEHSTLLFGVNACLCSPFNFD